MIWKVNLKILCLLIILQRKSLETAKILRIHSADPSGSFRHKKDGKRLYEMARKGGDLVDPRPVTIKEFEITKIELPKVFFRVVCSTALISGALQTTTEMRSEPVHTLSSLRRTSIGNFSVEEASGLEAFGETILL